MAGYFWNIFSNFKNIIILNINSYLNWHRFKYCNTICDDENKKKIK